MALLGTGLGAASEVSTTGAGERLVELAEDNNRLLRDILAALQK